MLQRSGSKRGTVPYSAVLVDPSLVESEPDEVTWYCSTVGGATIPVYLNLGISGIDRVVRELRAALDRRKLEVVVASGRAEPSQ